MTGSPPPAVLAPVLLAPNRPAKFYRASGAAAALRRAPAPDDHRPEEWIASTTAQWGSESDGLSRLPDGRWLADAVAGDPGAWLGPEHVAAFGDDVALLVKLLDAGERLPVHLHPPRGVVPTHLGRRHGKTEAWVVLATAGAGADVWVGFAEDQTRRQVEDWVARQDIPALLGALNRLEVSAGDAVLVPAGTPHAIGEGMLCVELQEPTDFSLNLEWAGFDLPDCRDGQLGLPAAKVLDVVQRKAVRGASLDALRRRAAEAAGVTALLPPAAGAYFRADRIRPAPLCRIDASFSVLVVAGGAGRLAWGDGSSERTLAIRRGDVLVAPWAAGPLGFAGDVDVVCCRPPDPAGGWGARRAG